MEWDEIRAGQQNRSAGQMSKSDGSRLGKGGGAKWTFPSLVPFGFRVGYHHWVLQPILIGEASIHQAPLLLSVESRECLRVGNPVSAWDQTLKPRLNFLSLDLTHFPSAPSGIMDPGVAHLEPYCCQPSWLPLSLCHLFWHHLQNQPSQSTQIKVRYKWL